MLKKCSCRRCLVLLMLLLFIIGGGLVLWQFLPEQSKDALSSSVVADTPELPTYQFQKCSTNSTECCNGLDSICDLQVDQIMYAGLHNAMAARENGFLLAPNHLLGLEAALQSGYRAINLDIARCDGELLLIHGRCAFGSRDPREVFVNLNKFLTTHPSETVILVFQVVQPDEEEDSEPVMLAEIDEIIQSIHGLPSKLYHHPPESGYEWPTLRELRQNRTQVILFHYNSGGLCRDGTIECPTGFHDWFVYAKETEYSFSSLEEVADTPRSCVTTRGTSKATLLAVNNFVTLPNRAVSAELNDIDFLQVHIPACAELNGQDVNVVFIDFWTSGNLPLYVQRQNTIRATNAAVASKSRDNVNRYL